MRICWMPCPRNTVGRLARHASVWLPAPKSHWPGWALDWLTTPGSLTVRLKTRGGFRVEPICQTISRVHHHEKAELTLHRAINVRTRNVRLHSGGQVCVLAHTVVKLVGQRCDWPFWRLLGQQSLGTVLFKDHSIDKGDMSFARIPPGHCLHPGQGFGVLYARRRCYNRRRGMTPLMVTEVFLPTLQEPPIMPAS